MVPLKLHFSQLARSDLNGVAMAAKAGPTLEEVLVDTPPRKLDQPCKDMHLCHIAREITNWVFLAPFLRVKEPEVEAIRGKWPFNVPAQNLELLRRWRRKHLLKDKDTYRNLCKAFMNAKEVTLAETVCSILRGQGDSSESSSDESDKEPIIRNPSQISPAPAQKSNVTSTRPQSTHTGSKADAPKDLARQLRMSYGCRPPSYVVLQWPPPPTLKVFNLAMIHSEETVQRTPLEEDLIRLTLYGSVDDIMTKKTAIKLEDLFQSGGNVKVVLVEGAPGAGKSTLSWDIVLKWVAQELFHDDFKIVIYVQFRDLNMHTATEIADLLPIMKSQRGDAASVIVGCHGSGVLFVLDGWDEYSPGLQRDSLFEQLICHPENLGVPLSTVLITSRPIASGRLQRYATSRVEIFGFMPDEVDRYFKDVFKNPVTVQKLYDHLKDRPTIKASCYLPLNAAIVAHLFMELNYTLPTTLHGLFCSLVLSCIIRHLTKESGTQPTITSLDELPTDVQKVFKDICILAYEGTMSNKVIFSSEDLRSYSLPDNMSTLSLMQVVQSFATGKPSSCHFLRLSIQELLTALHISKLPPPEQVDIFTELFGQPRFDTVFRFYAAFTKLQTEGIRNIISMIIFGLRMPMNLIHCLYEAQDASLCYFVSSHLRGKLDLSSITLSPLDLLSFKYFLSCVNCSIAESSDSVSFAETVSDLNLWGCGLTPEDIGSLSLRNLVRLDLRGNRVSWACAADILTNSPQLKTLILTHCDLPDDGVKLFAAALGKHQSLKLLYMNSCVKSSHATHHVLKAVLNHRSLQLLYIAACPVDTKDVLAVVDVNESLRVLEVSISEISESDSVVLAHNLRNNRTIEELAMYLLNRPKPGWMKEFVWSLRDCHLRTLHVFGPWGILGVSRQLKDQVIAIRRNQGLPPLEVFTSNM